MAMSNEEVVAAFRSTEDEAENQLARFVGGATSWDAAFESFQSLCEDEERHMRNCGAIRPGSDALIALRSLHKSLKKLCDALMGSSDMNFGKIVPELTSRYAKTISFRDDMRAGVSGNPLILLFACDNEWSEVFVNDAINTISPILSEHLRSGSKSLGHDQELLDLIFQATGVLLSKEDLGKMSAIRCAVKFVDCATSVANGFVSFGKRFGYPVREHMLYRWKDV